MDFVNEMIISVGIVTLLPHDGIFFSVFLNCFERNRKILPENEQFSLGVFSG